MTLLLLLMLTYCFFYVMECCYKHYFTVLKIISFKSYPSVIVLWIRKLKDYFFEFRDKFLLNLFAF